MANVLETSTCPSAPLAAGSEEKNGTKVGKPAKQPGNPGNKLVYSVPENSKTFVALAAHENAIDGFRRLDRTLVSDFPGDAAGFFIRYSVRGNQIGLGSKNKQAHFFPPGSYRRIGIGVEFERCENVNTKEERVLEHMGVVYVDLPQGYAAVIQQGSGQLILSSGRYVMRSPTKLMGTVNLKALSRTEKAHATTEQAVADQKGAMREELVEKTMESGSWQKVGAITFVRPSPGFSYVLQRSDGHYLVGSDFCVAAADEAFVGFLDYQMYSRTTRPFKFKSADFQDVTMKVQLSWRLVDGALWMLNRGAYEDVFDALEERAQATFRDAVGALKHEDVLAQKKEGFSPIEADVKPRLEHYAQQLGGELLDVQIREIFFPAFEEQAVKLAAQEALSKQQKREGEIQIELQKLADQKASVTKQAEYERKAAEARAQATLEEAQRQRDLAKEQAREQFLRAQVKAESAGKAAALEAQAEQEKRIAEINMAKSRAQAEVASFEAKAKADADLARIKAEAEAKAQAKMIEAEAEAKAVRLKAEAEQQALKAKAEAELQLLDAKAKLYKEEPELLRLEELAMQSNLAIKQATALADAIGKNPHALLSPELQAQVLPMLFGFPPTQPLVFGATAPGGIGASQMIGSVPRPRGS